MKEKAKRNKKIYEERIAGSSYSELIKKYGVSQARIQAIVAREKARLSITK